MGRKRYRKNQTPSSETETRSGSSSFLPFLPTTGKRETAEGWDRRGRQKTTTNQRVLVSTVGSLLSSLSFTPTKRYEEVDGVRKEKERLTTDHLSPRGEDWSLTFRFLVLSYTSAKGRASTSSIFCWSLAFGSPCRRLLSQVKGILNPKASLGPETKDTSTTVRLRLAFT